MSVSIDRRANFSGALWWFCGVSFDLAPDAAWRAPQSRGAHQIVKIADKLRRRRPFDQALTRP